MIMDRNHHRTRAKRKHHWQALVIWPAIWMTSGVLALALAAPAPAQLLLPAPGGNPQAIDFGHDPLLAQLAPAGDDDDFRAAVAAAVAAYPATGEAAANSDAARASQREAKSALFPVFNASLAGSRSLTRDFAGNAAVIESFAPRGRTDAQIGADQLLFDFGASGGRIAGASARLRAARAEADRSASDTVLAAATAWYQVLEFQALAEISGALVARHRSILTDTNSRVAAGLGAGGDTARAEASLADAIGDAARHARSLAAARAQFRQLFGADAPLHPPRPMLATSIATAETAAAMAHDTPPVVVALAMAEAARADARAVRGDGLPRLSAGVSGARYAAFESAGNYDVRGSFALRQTLSLGGAEAARTSAAQARARGAGFASDRVVAQAERDATTACADAQILDGSVLALADAYRANRRNRDTMAEQFRLSRGSLIDLLRTEDDYFAAARALLQGSIERDLAHLTLLARTGELLRHFAITPAPKD